MHQQGISLHHQCVAHPGYRKQSKAPNVIFLSIQANVIMQCMQQYDVTQQQQNNQSTSTSS